MSCLLNGGSVFFDSVLSGQDVANLQGVLLDGRHPFQFFPILQELERIIYIGRSPLLPMPGFNSSKNDKMK